MTTGTAASRIEALLQGFRSAKVKALGKVDAVCPEQRQGLFVLDALRDRLETERLGQADDRGHDVAVGRIRGEVAHEVDVDLDVGERQVLEVGEAAVAGAEVVEGKTAADLAQAAGEASAGGDVLHECGLGDLEDEVGGIGAALLGSGAR